MIFPGQGAQAPGLGTPWADHPAWAVVERAEKATGEALAPLLLTAPAEDLARTREAQLVVFLASLLAWEVVGPALDAAGANGLADWDDVHEAGGASASGPPARERSREARSEPLIRAFAGHSLGQLTALVAAGALPFDDGCRLAVRRAGHTQDAADARPGRLAALLGATVDQADEACAAAPGACWIANDNAPGQVVIGGTPDGVEAASAKAKELGVKRVMALNVGGAFHTPLMQAAADAFAADLAAAPFADTTVPVLSNPDARPYTDGAGWPARLADQLVRPVRWASTMPALAELGATAFVEVGPGSTLTGLAKRAVPDIALYNVASPDDLPLEIAHA